MDRWGCGTVDPAADSTSLNVIVVPARTAALLGLLVLVAFMVRFDALRNSAPEVPALGDAKAYHLLGANLADGKGYIRPFEALEGHDLPTAEYPPALPVLLAAADTVGIKTPDAQRVLLCGVGALSVGLIGLTARRLSGSDGVGYLAAAMGAIHPGLWNSDVSLMAEPLAAFMGAALVLVAIYAHDSDSWRLRALLGVMSGLGGLVRSELLFIGLGLIVALELIRWRQVPRSVTVASALRRFGLGLAGIGLVLVPWTVRNMVAFDGELVPLTNNSGSVARGANCDAAYRGQFRGLWVTNVTLDGVEPDQSRAGCFSGFNLVGNSLNEAQVSAQMRSEGTSYAREHLGELPKVMVARVARTVGLYQLDQQSNFAFAEGRNAIWDKRGTRSFQVLSLLAVAGLVLAAGRGDSPKTRYLLLIPIVCSLVVVAFTYGNPRFRAAAEPAVVVLAALGIWEIAKYFTRSRVDS